MQINQPELFSSDGITSRSGGRLGTKNHIFWLYFHIGRTEGRESSFSVDPICNQ